MIHVYGDESMDESKKRVCAVAVVTGSDADWSAAESKWLERTGGIPFHAKDCDTNPGRGVYANSSHPENKSLYRDLAILLASSGLWGIGVAIDIVAQRAVFPDAMDFVYFRAFLQVLEFVRQQAEAREDLAELTFDARMETDHNAALLYAQYREDCPGWKEHLAAKISFESSRDNPRIQMADLLARESMKALDNLIGPVRRSERLSWKAMRETGRFAVFVYSHEWFQDMKRKLPAMNKVMGFSEKDYHEWLRKRRRHHNLTNVFQFMEDMTKDRPIPDIKTLPDE